MADLDQALREALRHAADQVTSPRVPPDLNQQVRDRRRRRSLRAAAATATVAVTTLVLVVAFGGGRWFLRDRQEPAESTVTWTRSAESVPEAPIPGRLGAGVVWTGREFLVWGGQSAVPLAKGLPTQMTDGAAYDPATRRWRKVPAAPIVGRTHPIVYWTGKEVVVWGGNGAGGDRFDGAAYDPGTDSWRPIAAPDVGFAASGRWAARGPDLFVSGWDAVTISAGDAPGLETARRTVLRYNADADVWTSFQSPARVLDLATYRNDLLLLQRTPDGVDRVERVAEDGTHRGFLDPPSARHQSGDSIDHLLALRARLAVVGEMAVLRVEAPGPSRSGTSVAGQGGGGVRLDLWSLRLDAPLPRWRSIPVDASGSEPLHQALENETIFSVPGAPGRALAAGPLGASTVDVETGDVISRAGTPPGWPVSGCSWGGRDFALTEGLLFRWGGIQCKGATGTRTDGLLWRASD